MLDGVDEGERTVREGTEIDDSIREGADDSMRDSRGSPPLDSMRDAAELRVALLGRERPSPATLAVRMLARIVLIQSS